MASFAIETKPPGYDAEHCRVRIPAVSVVYSDGDGGSDSVGVYPTSVRWARDGSFSTAQIRYGAKYVGSRPGVAPGTPVKIVVVYPGGPTFTIFRGRAMNETHQFSSPSTQNVSVDCVGLEYDLFREVVFGQVGPMVDDDGSEAFTGGPVDGWGFFNALPTVFNPKLRELEQEVNTGKPAAAAPGNMLKVTGGYNVFDCNPYEPAEGDDISGRLWSAYDMITYLFAFAGGFGTSFLKSVYGVAQLVNTGIATTEIKLGPGNGLESVFPREVDVTGMPVNEAITKVCSAAGYSWWIDPEDGKMVFWHKTKGLPGFEAMYFGLKPIDGFATDGPRGLGSVTGDAWNVTDGQIIFNRTGIIDTVIGVSEPIRVQNLFPLRKGWGDTIQKAFLDIAVKGAPDSISGGPMEKDEVRSVTFEDGRTVELIRRNSGQNRFSVSMRQQTQEQTDHKAKGGAPSSIFRRWVTDETGRLTDVNLDPRGPYNFQALGLQKVNGSTYCMRPRPFLSRNVTKDEQGEPSPPKVAFGKVHPGQTDRTTLTDATGPFSGNVDDPVLVSYLSSPSDTYPYVSKGGRINFLKKVGGIELDGGNLEASILTIDPDTQKLFLFPPVVIATVEHDQGVAKVVKDVGPFPFARRRFDGAGYKKRLVLAEDSSYLDETEIRDAYGIPAGSLGDGDDDPSGWTPLAASVDESALMEKEMADILERVKVEAVAGNFTIPNIHPAYKLGVAIVALSGRLSFHAVVVAVTHDLLNMTTSLSIQSERFGTKRLR